MPTLSDAKTLHIAGYSSRDIARQFHCSQLKNRSPQPGTREILKDNGLYEGHAYSIINVKEVQVERERVMLLHMRNPWGHGEWNGPWSDRSKEWQSLTEKDKNATFKTRDDGEFWISMEDFHVNFDYLCMSHLTPDAHSKEIANNLRLTQWNISEHFGFWERGVSSGGPLRSFLSAKFWTNPQFKLSFSKASDQTAVIISLFEVDKPPFRSMGEISIGFIIFKMKKGRQPSRINEKNYYEFTPRLIATSRGFTQHREITQRFMMDPSDHVIVPCTLKEGQQAEFYLRIFSDRKIDAGPLKVEEEEPLTTVVETDKETEETELSPKLEEAFNQLAGELEVVDARDVVSLFEYTDDKGDALLNLETSRCLLSIATMKSKKNLASKRDLKEMLETLNRIKRVFKWVDSNNSKSVDRDELETLLKILEYNPNDIIVDAILKRYGGKIGRLSLEDFIQTCCRLMVLSSSYKEMEHSAKLSRKWEEWVQIGFL